jgi:hypothetical protein
MQTSFACGLRRGRFSNRHRFAVFRYKPEGVPQRCDRSQLAAFGIYGIAIRQTLRAMKG